MGRGDGVAPELRVGATYSLPEVALILRIPVERVHALVKARVLEGRAFFVGCGCWCVVWPRQWPRHGR